MEAPGVNLVSVKHIVLLKIIWQHTHFVYCLHGNVHICTHVVFFPTWKYENVKRAFTFNWYLLLLQFESFLIIPACASQSLGVSDKHKIPDAQMSGYLTYSTYLESNGRYGSSGYGWVGSNANSWLQVDLGTCFIHHRPYFIIFYVHVLSSVWLVLGLRYSYVLFQLDYSEVGSCF